MKGASDGSWVVELLGDLVAIKSVNPGYPGGTGEAAIANYVEEWGGATGLDVERQPVTPDRDNILATLIVLGTDQTLLFEAHMDTVGLDQMGDAGLLSKDTRRASLWSRCPRYQAITCRDDGGP